jgi:hypothetical protein
LDSGTCWGKGSEDACATERLRSAECGDGALHSAVPPGRGISVGCIRGSELAGLVSAFPPGIGHGTYKWAVRSWCRLEGGGALLVHPEFLAEIVAGTEA